MIVQDLINSAARQLRDTNLTYYTQGFMYESIREVIDEIANQSRTIILTEFHSVTLDKTDYALPERFLAFEMVEYFNGSRWYKLRPRSLVGERRLNDLSRLGLPAFYTLGPSARRLRASGTATGGSTTQLEHTGQDFTTLGDPPVTGDLVLNVTDDSEGYVLLGGVAATTVDLKGTLLGGSDNTFASGDLYEVLSYSSPLKSVRIFPRPTASDAAGVEGLAVHFSARHYDLDALMSDLGLDTTTDPCDLDIELDFEFEDAIREKLKARMLERRKGISHRDTIRQEGRGESKYLEALPNVRSRIDEAISTWHLGVGIHSGFQITRNGVLFSTV